MRQDYSDKIEDPDVVKVCICIAKKVIAMQQIRSIIQLLQKGFSLRVISHHLHLSSQQVTFYANPLKVSPYSFEELLRLPYKNLSTVVYEPEHTPFSQRKFHAPALPIPCRCHACTIHLIIKIRPTYKLDIISYK